MQIENVTKTLFTKQLSLSITYAWKGFDKKTGRKYGLLYRKSRHPTHLFFTAKNAIISHMSFITMVSPQILAKEGVFHVCLFITRVAYFVAISVLPDQSNRYLQSSPKNHWSVWKTSPLSPSPVTGAGTGKGTPSFNVPFRPLYPQPHTRRRHGVLDWGLCVLFEAAWWDFPSPCRWPIKPHP